MAGMLHGAMTLLQASASGWSKKCQQGFSYLNHALSRETRLTQFGTGHREELP
jgi:hypothetical protein